MSYPSTVYIVNTLESCFTKVLDTLTYNIRVLFKDFGFQFQIFNFAKFWSEIVQAFKIRKIIITLTFYPKACLFVA